MAARNLVTYVVVPAFADTARANGVNTYHPLNLVPRMSSGAGGSGVAGAAFFIDRTAAQNARVLAFSGYEAASISATLSMISFRVAII
jgi:hypothetical protein